MTDQVHFLSGEDGALYDLRDASWATKPLRRNYRRQHACIATVADFKATLRAGGYAWPGGYPLYFITSDGGALCFDCARQEFRNIADSIMREINDGWRVVTSGVNWEDANLTCDHCNARIESAYGEEE